MGKAAVRIFLAGIIYMAIGYVIHMLGAFASMKFYMDPNYFSIWSKIMMPTAGPPPLSFTIYSLLAGLLGGILFALVYYLIKDAVKIKGAAKKGLFYGLLVILISSVPFMLSMILLINLPLLLIMEWTAEAVIIILLSSMATAKLIK